MVRINVLGKEISELIAAGEVIERPASIIKELVENSLDAGANVITVELQNGGISYLRVTDNGGGIVKEDIPLAFLRHATSKVTCATDLDNISTLGFRGEALASISAVSNVTLMSKTPSSQEGYSITLSGGVQDEIKQVNCPVGTTIVVRDLFFNVPARLKFLKTPRAEAMAVGQILDKLAISHPKISIKFIVDNKIKFYTSGDGNAINAVSAVMGSEFSKELVPLHYEYNGMTIDGYITGNSFGRSNRGLQYFFVNSRYVKSKTCMVALEEGYKSAIMVGKFPGCVLNLTLPYDTVDVNVHPAKIEVRFSDEKAIFELVYFAIKNAINKNNPVTHVVTPQTVTLASPYEGAPQVEFVSITLDKLPESMVKDSTDADDNDEDDEQDYEVLTPKPYQTPSIPQVDTVKLYPKSIDGFDPITGEVYPAKTEALPAEATDKPSYDEKVYAHDVPVKTYDMVEVKPCETEAVGNVTRYLDINVKDNETEDNNKPKNQLLQLKYIGEMFKTYIVIEINDCIVTIDKHAAHERIIFEKLKDELKDNISRQILLSPINVYLSKDEVAAIIERGRVVNEIGFRYTIKDDSNVVISEVPLILDQFDVREVFLEVVDKLIHSHIGGLSEVTLELLHSMACRKAIKANDLSYQGELMNLARYVIENNEIRYCPHGRPIAIVEKKRDIDKKFGRV